MKLTRAVFLIPALFVIGFGACKREVTILEPEAREFAGEALARYCRSHKLSPKDFNLKEIGPVGDLPWMLVYVSSGIRPVHEVVVMIDKNGGVELSMDVQP